ncbi:MAG: DNA polymerase III subunit alpha [Methylococcales bacterium]|nr:DNA polymerase III subunit alpha [Methylococcales bacterium]MBT7409046.1 DNA polymerase III subunit alpha [Methylococcales bacterium]
MPASPQFVHLHLHSEFSLIDGTVRIKPLMKATAEHGMSAVTITDQSNLFALVKHHNTAIGAGIKPLFGADLWLANEEASTNPFKIILLAKNETGYRSLTRIVSRAYLEGQNHGVPIIEKHWLKDESSDLIALSGAREGDIGNALLSGKKDLAEQLLDEWLLLFDDRFYIELQRTQREHEETYINLAIELAAKKQVPVVATNDVRFLTKKEFEAHEARVCIHDGRVLDDPRRPRLYSEEQYFKTPQEMTELFADIPEAITNTVEIAKRCSLSLSLGKNYLPDFPLPDGMTIDDFFIAESKKGLEKRFPDILDIDAADFEEKRKAYDERLDIELKVILSMGFPGYFLIVADFIQWAKDNGVPVGPGRGSGAGSLVAYALLITDIDPLKYELLFERFLNPERVSMPDFDIDFCMEGRDRVIDYVAETYGRDQVSQIITYGTMAAKAVVRDVGRVLGHPYGLVDQVAKLIPFDIGMTLTKALKESEDLKKKYDSDEEVKGLIDLALSLEGVSRNAGKHAGGVVISPSVLTDFTPLYCEAGGANLVTQFDKNDVEAVGLVKFDFLGLRTLTIIDWALKNIAKNPDEEPININLIPLDDPATFDLFKRYDTTAVFQLESEGMKKLIKNLQPDNFEDIIALVALYRPGPLGSGMVDDFVDRKHGRAEIEYPHPDLAPILEPTYGVILYQEQVMQIAQILAGYSLGGADLLRRAMGKKKPEEMVKQRVIFLKGTSKNKIDDDTANYIFDLMEKFAGYGFNKSHSAAYALVSYQTAWLKAHHSAAFMAAVLSSDMDNTDKVVTFIEDCRKMKMTIHSPNVNISHYKFTNCDEKSIVYGLGAIKGVGLAAIEGIIKERQNNGDYKSLLDFCARVDLGKVNKRVLMSLIKAGAFDVMQENRASMTANLATIIQTAEQQKKVSDAGQFDLFGFGEDQQDTQIQIDMPAHDEWDDDQRLMGEKETLGLYLTGHPINQYLEELKNFTTSRISELSVPPQPKQDNFRSRGIPVTVAGLVIAIRTKQNQRGGKMAFITLDDRSGRIEVSIFAEVYEQHNDIINIDNVLVVSGKLSHDDFRDSLKIVSDEILDMNKAREKFAKFLVIDIKQQEAKQQLVQQLSDILTPFCHGSCRICIEYTHQEAKAQLVFGDDWKVRPTDELVKRLSQLTSDNSVALKY